VSVTGGLVPAADVLGGQPGALGNGFTDPAAGVP